MNCRDLSLIHNYLIEYAETGIINEDVADLFSLERFVDNGRILITVNFVED